MIASLRRMIDNFRGFGDAAPTLPPLDGAFRPNMDIEEAPVVARCGRPSNLVASNGEVWFSDGPALCKLSHGSIEVVEQLSSTITAIAARADGGVAVALDSGNIQVHGGTRPVATIPAPNGGSITGLAELADGGFVATVGSSRNRAADWQRDLMERNRAGSIWHLDSQGKSRKLADSLAYPAGVCRLTGESFAVSLAWEASVATTGMDGNLRRVVTNLPGYPSRIAPASSGGYWLALFAPRNQLVEFVLRETEFRGRMLRDMPSERWVAPALRPPTSPLQVMQEGAQKIGGTIKPWAPSLSYGLVVRLGSDFLPRYSHHSRANGVRHGITSVVEHGGHLLAASGGSGVIVALPAE